MPDISLNSVTLTRGRMTFTDRFVKPNYVAELSSIDGSITAVSSTNPQPAKVKVTGRVYTTAPLSRAISRLRSSEPVSTMTISSTSCLSDARQPGRKRSSLRTIMAAVMRGMAPPGTRQAFVKKRLGRAPPAPSWTTR